MHRLNELQPMWFFVVIPLLQLLTKRGKIIAENGHNLPIYL